MICLLILMKKITYLAALLFMLSCSSEKQNLPEGGFQKVPYEIQSEGPGLILIDNDSSSTDPDTAGAQDLVEIINSGDGPISIKALYMTDEVEIRNGSDEEN